MKTISKTKKNELIFLAVAVLSVVVSFSLLGYQSAQDSIAVNELTVDDVDDVDASDSGRLYDLGYASCVLDVMGVATETDGSSVAMMKFLSVQSKEMRTKLGK